MPEAPGPKLPLQVREDRDDRRIDVRDVNEIEFWTKALDVPLTDLLIVIDRVGTSADLVRASSGAASTRASDPN